MTGTFIRRFTFGGILMLTLVRLGQGLTGSALGLRALMVLVLGLCLTACGGGGSSQNLSVVYNYADANNSNLLIFQSTSLLPQADGVGGHTPTFTIVSGGLPPGLTLNTRTGEISGRPTAATTISATIRLTVDGYSGSLDTVVQLHVRPFWVGYPGDNFWGQRGSPLSTNTPFKPVYDSAVSMHFELWSGGSALPPGMTLDAKTGEIAGTPLEAGNYSFFVQATASYGGLTSQTEVRVNYFIDNLQAPFVFTPQVAQSNENVTLMPSTGLQPGDTLTNFRWVAGGTGLPPSMTLDSTTGVVSGVVPGTKGNYNAFVEATFTRGSIVETFRSEVLVIIL